MLKARHNHNPAKERNLKFNYGVKHIERIFKFEYIFGTGKCAYVGEEINSEHNEKPLNSGS